MFDPLYAFVDDALPLKKFPTFTYIYKLLTLTYFNL